MAVIREPNNVERQAAAWAMFFGVYAPINPVGALLILRFATRWHDQFCRCSKEDHHVGMG